MRYKIFLATIFIIDSIPRTIFASGFMNPIESPGIQKLLIGFINAITYVGMPVLVVFVVIVGFRFVVSQGNAKALNISKAFSIKVLIGGTIFIALWMFARVVGVTLGVLSVSSLFIVVIFFFYVLFSKK